MVSGFSLGPLILLQLVPLWLLIWGALTVCALLIVLFVALSVKVIRVVSLVVDLYLLYWFHSAPSYWEIHAM